MRKGPAGQTIASAAFPYALDQEILHNWVLGSIFWFILPNHFYPILLFEK